MKFTAPPPLSLYVHIPWCVRKCPYCDFNSHGLREAAPPVDDYVAALLADLEQELPAVWGRTVQTVFIGGGTPSLFPAAAIERLLAGIRSRVNLRPGAEITLEANPGTIEHDDFAAYREAGVTRLSLGVQSFDDDRLVALGRIHDGATARAAAEAALAAGFESVNLDLMFGLPQQSVADALADLETAVGLGPGQISWYQLTVEPNTAFHREPPPLPDDDACWTMQQAGHALLAAHGYTQYEVSAHARTGHRCRHNLNYWRFGDYIGIGAGAHGKITDAGRDCVQRYWKVRHPRDYLKRVAAGTQTAERRTLSTEDAIFEYAMNALRLNTGFTPDAFESATGLPFGRLSPMLARARDLELIAPGDTRVAPSERGRRYLDELVQLFLPEAVT